MNTHSSLVRQFPTYLLKVRRLLLCIIISGCAITAGAQSNPTMADSLSEVVVTGSNNATPRKLLPYSVSIVGKDQIEATGRTQLLSALTGRVPSLFVTERNIFGFGISTGGSGGIKMRGIGNSPTSQILMMVDGKPQFAGVYSHHVADNYESEYVDHIEIVRGPSSVLYGSNAMGGTINVITKTAKTDGVRTTLQSQYGSYNTWQSSATNMVRKGKFSSLLSLGYDRTDGTQQDFDLWQASGYAKAGYDFTNNWSAYLDYTLMKFKGNDPIYAKLANPAATDIYHQDVLRGEGSIVATNRYTNTNGAMRIYYAHGKHDITDPKPFNMKDSRFGILAYQNYQPTHSTNLTLGFDYDLYTGEVPLSGGIYRKDKVTPATMDRRSISEYSPYLTASQGICRNLLIVNAGLRMANSSMFGTHLIPQAGLAVNPSHDLNIKLNMSKGYRNPSFKELYLYKMANPDLKPEDMWNYEASVGKRFANLLSVELTAFISKGNNIIQQVYSQQLGSQHNENTGSFVNKGIELSASSRPIDNLALRATYSYLHSDISGLTGAPRHLYSLAADWTVASQWTLNADLTGVGRLYVSDDIHTQDYALLNLRLTYRPLNMLDIFVQGHNITCAKYYINKGYRMPGATVSGGFKLKL